MKLMNGSKRNGAAPVKGWPERVDRRLLTVMIVALVVVAPMLSMTVFSKHTGAQTIVVEPGSYYAIHAGVYGFGTVAYSTSGGGSEIYLLELDWFNFQKFKAGMDYDYIGYQALGGGSGHTVMGGVMWGMYLVFVNDMAHPDSVTVEVDVTVYYGLPAAALVAAALGGVYFVLGRRSRRERAGARRPTEAGRAERRKALLFIAGLVGLMAAVLMALGFLLPQDTPVSRMVMVYGQLIGAVLCSMIAFAVSLRLREVKGAPADILADLAYRLRVSGYLVTERRGTLTVRISSTSTIKVSARAAPGGTALRYRIGMTPPAAILLVVCIMAPMFMASLWLAFVLFMIYRTAVFASDRVLPRLSQLPVPRPPAEEEDTRKMLIKGLAEGRRLSAEAHEAARSTYHDAIILSVVASLMLSFALGLFLSMRVLGSESGATVLLTAEAFAALAGISSSVVSWRLLTRRWRPLISDTGAWSARLEAALAREASGRPAPDGEPSSFELIAGWYEELPKWLKARRKGGMLREPGQWLLIFFAGYQGVTFALSGALGILQESYSMAMWYFAGSAVLFALATGVYLHWRKTRREEDGDTVARVDAGLRSLKAEMEKYLGGV